MPKLPRTAAKPPLVTPLAEMKLKPVFVDRNDGKLRIRTLLPAEVTTEIAEWLTDPAVMEGLNAPTTAMGLEAFRAYAASFDNLRRSLICVRKLDDDQPIALIFFEVDLRHKSGTFHLIIGEAGERGQKVAFRVTALMIRHFFDERKLEKLTFQPLSRNIAAVAACQNYGLRLEGIMRAHRIDGRTGERLDQHVFGMVREEYLEAFAKLKQVGFDLRFEGPGVKPA